MSETFGDADRFADIAAHSPDVLDDDLLGWLTRAIFDEQSRRRAEGEPDTTSVTLPDWAVEQLTELLATDHDGAPVRPEEDRHRREDVARSRASSLPVRTSWNNTRARSRFPVRRNASARLFAETSVSGGAVPAT
ncbi:hypothetical protein [Saccharothrix sp. S26]|uniref:hypothetical protein n=1 Tax=Saccharothrix sp. S26 TaxID=2907215 RepID=UPI001F248A56|nr:hypothetical protein [Saccharothrix sp. S26]